MNLLIASGNNRKSRMKAPGSERVNKNEKVIPPSQPNHDKLFKVQPFLDAVIKAFHKEYWPN